MADSLTTNPAASVDDDAGAGNRKTPGGGQAVRWMLVVGVVVVVVVRLMASIDPSEYLDLRVFIGAVDSMVSGHSVYDFAIDDHGTPTRFLYPPFAAITMIPLAWLPFAIAGHLWELIQVALSCLLVWRISREAGGRSARSLAGVALLAAVWVATVLSVPVSFGIVLGQVGVLLVALVAVDFLLMPPKWRGVLTGIAAAIKLVPLLFIPYLLVTKQWRAAATATGVFLGAGLLALLVLPADSIRYWTEIAFSTSRFPGVGSNRNKSLLGVLQYGGVDWAGLFWVLASVVIVLAALRVASRHYRRGEEAAAVVLVGVASGIVSPVSWDHHLVWLVLAGAYLVLVGTGWFRVSGWALLISVSFFSAAVPGISAEWAWVYLALPTVLGLVLVIFGLPGRSAAERRLA